VADRRIGGMVGKTAATCRTASSWRWPGQRTTTVGEPRSSAGACAAHASNDLWQAARKEIRQQFKPGKVVAQI
jgi:hypothetical protein